tara:strand:+ start:1517 stop:1699 length:183 start_codon:yes stop_codon:yes gene_type:complete
MPKTQLQFECIIELDEDDDVQVSHLPEEIQAYLDSNYGEDNTAKVLKWRSYSLEDSNNEF